jgi:hypothetical protein
MSDQSNQTGISKEVVVVMRGPSAATFKPDEELPVKNVPSAIGPVNIAYTTRYLSRAPDVTLPGQLWIDIRGNARTLAEALEPFANSALTILPILSLSANASIGEPDIELGFDNTAGLTERDFFQSYIPPERDIPHPGRGIDMPATVALLQAIGAHPHSERLLRGANQYRLALQSWRLGKEALSLAHVWMAVEAITKAKVRTEYATRGITEPDLAKELGIEREQFSGKRLEQGVRKDLLLKGDNEAYRKAKEASDAFEHGYLNYGKVRELSRDVGHRVAEYVRTAILEMCGLDTTIFSKITSDPFDKPLGHWPIVKYLRGKLIGPGEELAAPGNAYPFIKWDFGYKAAKWEGGKYNVEITENLTPEIAEGISFQAQSFEAWQAG